MYPMRFLEFSFIIIQCLFSLCFNYFNLADCQSCNFGYLFDGRSCYLYARYVATGQPFGYILDLSTQTFWRSAGTRSLAVIDFSQYLLRQGFTYQVCPLL